MRKNVTYALSAEKGALEISGTGAIYDWDYWNDIYSLRHRDRMRFKTAKISDDVTGIGGSALYDCSNLKTIYLYRNSTVDEYFSDGEYTKIYLDNIQPQKGDTNGDGKKNAKDVVLLAKAPCGLDIEIDKTAADLNLDGVFDIKDLVLMAQYLTGWNATLG